ncbi:MAG: relaxase/mobilization nuclease domain-containing protein [Acutalibacteraceae bacterium]
MKRTVKKQFWFSKVEAQDLKKKAKKACLTEAALIRLLLRGYEPREKPDERFYDAMRELSAIGNNINQLAIKANALGFVDSQMLKNEALRWHKFQAAIEREFLRPEKKRIEMAVTKLWKVSVRLDQVLDYTTNPEKTANPEYSAEDYQALKDVLAYAKDEEKTEHEFFCDGINCNVAMARDQFITVKEQFDKTDGIQAYHGYLSFKENEVTPEQAQQIGMEFARKMWGKRFQVVVTTHLNTKHLHCHFVINSVSFVDGKRLKDKEKSWYYFRHIADEICLEHKLSIVEKPELHRSPSYLTMKDEAGMPTRYNNAKKAIDEAIAMSRNLRQFQYELGVMGYHSNFSPNRKYATVTPKGSEKPIRTYRLGEEYTKEKILERLIANRDNIVFKPFQPKTYIVRQYRLPTRESRIQKVGGLYGLYLYYCYRLGYLPKHNQKQQNTARLHYLLKDDLMKMDELTKQVTLLGKHQIGTDEQLFSYKRSVEDEIKTLTADRTHLRNEIRKVDISDERLSAAKMKISAISERLKELRKEVKLCDGIAKRSGVIADTLSQVKAEEEKSQRKESRNYEQRR